MTNSISGATPTSQPYQHQVQQAHQQQIKQEAEEPKDTVTLSPQAKGAASDTDHDGH